MAANREGNSVFKDPLQSNPSTNESHESMADSGDPPHGKAIAHSTPPDNTPAATNIAPDNGSTSVQSEGIGPVASPSLPQPKRKSKVEPKESKELPKKGKSKGKNKTTSNSLVPSSNTKNTTDSDAHDPDASLVNTQLHRTAILASITGQPFEDMKFFAFSRRTRTRKAVSKALPLVANSRFIRNATAHFDSGTSSICSMLWSMQLGFAV